MEKPRPSLRGIYGIDPSLTDMVMFASYDANYLPNLHNTVVESNLPGGLEEHYVLAIAIGVDDRPPPASNIASMKATPNPFNPRTTIHFQLASPAIVTVNIYDCAGRRVRTLAASEPRTAGDHFVVWDGLDEQGRALPSGTYLCLVNTGDGSAQAKLCLVR